jgi:hypothetical protein
VFVPACLTPGTTALLVVHNHPSGNPAPSPDDARLTLRLAQAADVLDMPLLDHLIVGDAGRYFSFRVTGTLAARIADDKNYERSVAWLAVRPLSDSPPTDVPRRCPPGSQYNRVLRNSSNGITSEIDFPSPTSIIASLGMVGFSLTYFSK